MLAVLAVMVLLVARIPYLTPTVADLVVAVLAVGLPAGRRRPAMQAERLAAIIILALVVEQQVLGLVPVLPVLLAEAVEAAVH